MNLALFTPAAYLWPVLRNFDVFIASLGAPRADAETLSPGALYPLREPQGFTVLDRRLERRLQDLQHELYAALLRENAYYSRESRTVDQVFWPDLVGTSIGDLLEAFYFYFAHRLPSDMQVNAGLSVLRSVFFNHATAEPELWMHAAGQRLAGVRDELPSLTARFHAPLSARLQDLAFAVNMRRGASPLGSGWLHGELRRAPTGLLRVTVSCGAPPDTSGEAARLLQIRMRESVETVFGWTLAEAA